MHIGLGISLGGSGALESPETPAPSNTLTPGATPNWTATSTPAPQGNPAHLAYDTAPIALWTATSVNFQTYSSSHRIGVVALHACGPENSNCGIQRVRFIANDGAPLDVSLPTLNTASGYYEFWCDVEPLDDDGLVEIRAIVYPSSGIPFVMQGGFITEMTVDTTLPAADECLLLWSNANGSYDGIELWVDNIGAGTPTGTELLPFETIQDAVSHAHFTLGGLTSNLTIRLKTAGDYEMDARSSAAPLTPTGWMHFRPASGLTWDDVRIVNRSGADDTFETRLRLIHLVDMSVPMFAGYRKAFYCSSDSYPVSLWCEGCLMESDLYDTTAAAGVGSIASGAVVQRYMHKSAAHARNQILNGREMAQFVQMQDFVIINTSRDVASANRLTRGFRVEGIQSNGGDHVDFAQTFSSFSDGNCLWIDGEIVLNENVNGIIFQDYPRNRIGFVNLVASCPIGVGSSCINGGGMGIYWHLTMPDQQLKLVTDPGDAQYAGGGMEESAVSVQGCIVSLLYETKGSLSFEDFAADNPNRFDGNRFLVGSLLIGTNYTTGTPTWTNADAGNFRTAASIPVARFLPWDAEQTPRTSPTQAGAYELSS